MFHKSIKILPFPSATRNILHCPPPHQFHLSQPFSDSRSLFPRHLLLLLLPDPLHLFPLSPLHLLPLSPFVFLLLPPLHLQSLSFHLLPTPPLHFLSLLLSLHFFLK